ncbi:MFS transporter [Caryophanon latum]|uniref:MFS transporter n=1 Tax=Caryophanon latum TaxID=33977 RepID=A0A1C0Z209_9BACL|nr:MFS transporter [Caryophanon latum]OCS93451.1 MFS transporter [Caryophanon latum]
METKRRVSSQTWAIILFSLGVFMAALDNGIISAALTTINDSFGVDANWGAWGVTLYTLGLAISVPIVGKLSDRYGRKKLFIVEIAIFGLGSLLVALSPNFTFYLIARFIQAMGGGGIFIIGSSHILSTLPIDKQGKALGMLGGMNGMAAVLGPNVGSIILDWTGSWHWLFLINVPIAIFLVVMGILKLEETKDPTPGKLDLFGTVLLSLAILGIMYGLTNVDGLSFFKGLLATNVYPYLLAAIGIFIMLYVYENKLVRRGADPILPVTLMKQPRFLVTLLIGALSGAMLSAMIFVPAFSQQVLGISAEHSGYWMTPLALAAGIGAGLGGALVDKRGPIIAVALSGFVAAIGFLLFPLWIDVKWQFIVASVVSGVGMGILLGAPLNMLATEKLQDNKGTALASLSLVRTLGMTIAPTIYAGFIARGFNDLPTLFQTDFMAKFQQNMQGVELSQAGAQELQQLGAQFASADMSQQQMIESVNAVQDPALKEALMLTVQQLNEMAAQQGYGGLFMSAAVISAGVLLLAFVLKPLREK